MTRCSENLIYGFHVKQQTDAIRVFVNTTGPHVYGISTKFLLFWRPLFNNLLMLIFTKTDQTYTDPSLSFCVLKIPCSHFAMKWQIRIPRALLHYWIPYQHILSTSSPKVKHFFPKLNTLLYWTTSTGFIQSWDLGFLKRGSSFTSNAAR